MSVQKPQTGFVEAGTALANLHVAMPGRSRNMFRRDGENDIVEVSDIHVSDAVISDTGQAWSRGRAQSDTEVWWSIDPKPVLIAPQQVTLPLAIWEGVVEEIDYKAECFYAHLSCKGRDSDEHRVEMLISSVEPSDLDLLAVGAVFYLEQYQRNRRGGREQIQILRFRRCVTWTRRALDWARSEASAMDAVLRPYVEPEDSE